MLSLNNQVSSRTPPVHEKIALQSALNVSKLAAALPKPRNRWGELPVLVELRRADDNVIYRYQVNLPPDCVNPEPPQLTPAEITALSQELQLPCLVHGGNEATGLIDSSPKLVMVLSSEHVVPGESTINQGELGSSESIVTHQYGPFVCEPSEKTQDLFMSALHGPSPWPSKLKVIPLGHGKEMFVEKPWPDNVPAIKPASPPINGYKLPATNNPPNGYKKHSNWSPSYDNNAKPKRVGTGYKTSSYLTPRKQPLLPTPTAVTIRNFKDSRVKPWSNNQLMRNGVKDAHTPYRFMPRIENYSQRLELQRELQLRTQRELEQQQKKLREQQSLNDILTKPQLPQELQSMFLWDSCRLCHTAMTSKRTALDHYLSRTHQRRVDTWMMRNSFTMGQYSAEMLRHLRSSGPAVLHCDLCDLKLSSMLHALQHFYGRRHRLVERQISKPNGEGYYDDWGNWVRTNDKWLMCQLCDVIVTSESQLGLHMAGVRHRKRERSNCSAVSNPEIFDGTYIYRINSQGILVPFNCFTSHNLAGRHKREIPIPDDLNANYYCELCNLTLNHKKSAKQHVEGRGHSKKQKQNTRGH